VLEDHLLLSIRSKLLLVLNCYTPSECIVNKENSIHYPDSGFMT
jgi:hypothetical protein